MDNRYQDRDRQWRDHDRERERNRSADPDRDRWQGGDRQSFGSSWGDDRGHQQREWEREPGRRGEQRENRGWDQGHGWNGPRAQERETNRPYDKGHDTAWMNENRPDRGWDREWGNRATHDRSYERERNDEHSRDRGFGTQGRQAEPDFSGGGLQSATSAYNTGSSTYGGGVMGSWGREQQQQQAGRGRFAGRGPKGYQRSDERIREEVNEKLTQHPDVDATEMDVYVNTGEVTLSGSVESRHEKRLAEDCCWEVSGVKEVHNQLRVGHESRQPQGAVGGVTPGVTGNAGPGGGATAGGGGSSEQR